MSKHYKNHHLTRLTHLLIDICLRLCHTYIVSYYKTLFHYTKQQMTFKNNEEEGWQTHTT